MSRLPDPLHPSPRHGLPDDPPPHPTSRREALLMTVGSMLTTACAQAPALPRVGAGRLERLPAFPSRHIESRHVDVWLPHGYPDGGPHAVLYMHDGQMLFDPDSTWNRQAWRVDRAATLGMADGRLRSFIVVGPHNHPTLRHAEFFPQGFLPHLAPSTLRQRFVDEALKGQPRADTYLRFLIEELKPAIDARYATDRGRDATFLMGSSMGGLISLYGLCEYPQVFGGAAALSTHWIGTYERNDEIPSAALAYLRRRLPPPGQVRLYMDRGTTELDAKYDQAQPRIDALMAEKGFAPPRFVTRVFDGAGHNEVDWSKRLHIPLEFLLGRAPGR